MNKKVLTAALLSTVLMTVACTPGSTRNFDGKTKNVGYSYLYDLSAIEKTVPVNNLSTVGAEITVEKDCFLTSLSVFVEKNSENATPITLKIYKWLEDYEASVKKKAAFTKTLKDFYSGRVTFQITDGLLGEGSYVYVLSSSKESCAAGHICKAGENTAGVSIIKGFESGTKSTKVPKTIATFSKYTESAGAAKNYTKLTEGKAHVIVITGQSNASGQSYISYLEEKIAKSRYQKYAEGFENILIDYNVDNANSSCGFVPVTLSQGAGTDRFGPELGLAEYLDKTYPGEKFYIIKSAWSGSGLTKHLQDTNSEYQYIKSNILNSITRLKDLGLDPEVFAVCWMQGETDSWYYEDTEDYFDREADLIDRITAFLGDNVAPNGFAFLDAAISDSYAWTLAPVINTQKERLALERCNNYYIDTYTEGLGCYADNNDIAHYDCIDMIRLGEMYGDGIKQVVDNSRL